VKRGVVLPLARGEVLADVVGQQSGGRLVDQPQDVETRRLRSLSARQEMHHTVATETVHPYLQDTGGVREREIPQSGLLGLGELEGHSDDGVRDVGTQGRLSRFCGGG